jgi:DeoR/GlpR family transcriptional regulator of sugar metabolism
MKRSRAFVEDRRQLIVSLLEENGQMSVTSLAEKMDVSALTMRRDLDYLQEQGTITRQYGTAKLATGEGSTTQAQERAKSAIAKAAARYVEDDETIFINTSTTALAIVPFITAENVTIITNNGKALQMPLKPTMTILLTGGEIRVPKWSMTGDFALGNINQVKASKCFMGCTGLSAAGGLTTGSFQEGPVNALMIERSEQHFALADASKIGLTSSFKYSPASGIDHLVTDTMAPGDELTRLREAGVQAIDVVNPNAH